MVKNLLLSYLYFFFLFVFCIFFLRYEEGSLGVIIRWACLTTLTMGVCFVVSNIIPFFDVTIIQESPPNIKTCVEVFTVPRIAAAILRLLRLRLQLRPDIKSQGDFQKSQ
jgi:hypothetical protein